MQETVNPIMFLVVYKHIHQFQNSFQTLLFQSFIFWGFNWKKKQQQQQRNLYPLVTWSNEAKSVGCRGCSFHLSQACLRKSNCLKGNHHIKLFSELPLGSVPLLMQRFKFISWTDLTLGREGPQGRVGDMQLKCIENEHKHLKH